METSVIVHARVETRGETQDAEVRAVAAHTCTKGGPGSCDDGDGACVRAFARSARQASRMSVRLTLMMRACDSLLERRLKSEDVARECRAASEEEDS